MRPKARHVLPAVLALALSGCSLGSSVSNLFTSKPAKPEGIAQLPPAPKPIYQPGDTFVFNDDGTVVQEQVVGVAPDRVTWTNDSGLIWTSTNELVTPQLSWSSHPELGRGRQTVIGNPGALFPLQEGNVVAFGVRGSSEKVPTGWEDELRCVVAGQQNVTVPAGTFTTFRIDCKRKDLTQSLYYAPVAQNYVLRERTFANAKSRKELISVSLAGNRTAEIPPLVEQAQAEKNKEMVAAPEAMMKPEAAAAPTPPTGLQLRVEKGPMETAGTAGEGLDPRLNILVSRLEAVVEKLEVMSSSGAMEPPSGRAAAPAAGTQAARPAATPQPAKSGKFGIHLASFRTVDAARRSWDTLTKRYPNELGKLSFATTEFDAGDGKGTFVRLVGAAFETRDAANRACSELKAKRQFCQAVQIAR